MYIVCSEHSIVTSSILFKKPFKGELDSRGEGSVQVGLHIIVTVDHF